MTNPVDRIRQQLTPPKALSWQSLILVSALFWLILAVALGIQYDWSDLGVSDRAISQLAWILLFAGLTWWQLENPVRLGGLSIGPWIISALVCALLFIRPSGEISPLVWVVWPLLAAAIAVFPRVRGDSNSWTIPSVRERSALILLILGSFIVSCWFGFSLIIQGWLATYPELMAADVSGSNFVVRLGEVGESEGKTIIDEMQAYIAQQTNGKPWGTVERFLLDIQLGKINFKQQVAGKLPNSSNLDEWTAWVEIVKGSEYDLKLYFRKPNIEGERMGYSLTKTCYLRQSNSTPQRSGGELLPTGKLFCDIYPQFNFE
ncbi:MAG TPA: DUF5357 family protein [Oscillatoriales cyanobacterium M59_W2019_021]|nr:MAG: hypothetical protein D6728_13115 [Cyanobacteria bacterium J055]HIK32364.1 DUF5357 family protein [Oscillatoriales cyanobacterium M4454_W2019_049]HIK50540.1 DUF5357 family protein [Oscillatoriales cyanobacterium M59_W2019_021]